jgi:hypothetical protein
MMFELVITLFAKVFGIVYKWLDHAIIIIAAILFLLFNVFLIIKHLKKLPKYYVIEIVDIYGNKTTVESLRLIFTTYDAAESYARFYQDIYKEQYKFRVTGLEE